MTSLSLTFCWWNTKLRPPRKRKAAPQPPLSEKNTVDVLSALLDAHDCQLIGLGEVGDIDPLSLLPRTHRERWGFVHNQDFGIALLFDSEVISELDHYWDKAYFARAQVRVGLIATLALYDEHIVTLSLSHWPSDMMNSSEAADKRQIAAQQLHKAVIDAEGEHIIIMGDFNCEPFDSVFSSGLKSTRYRAAASYNEKKNTAGPTDMLLYNASWRWLGEKHAGGPSLAGTYKIKGVRPSAWRTFDQLLVSPSLIGQGAWFLDEESCGICEVQSVYCDQTQGPRRPFDHLPLVGCIRRRSKND